MAGINFKGVTEAKDKVSTRPGTIGVFTISEVKFDTTKNKGTYYMGVTFTRSNDEFSHSFFLTEKALSRIKSLVKHTAGVELDSEVMEEKLIALLKGKEIALKVTARIDETNGRAYPDLGFAGFCKNPTEISALVFSSKEEELNKKAADIYASYSAKADGPAPVATASATEDEIF